MLSNSPQSRITLFAIIEALEVRCLKCCRSGGLWKKCVRPIVDKWNDWNNKWNAFRMPPDPMLDD